MCTTQISLGNAYPGGGPKQLGQLLTQTQRSEIVARRRPIKGRQKDLRTQLHSLHSRSHGLSTQKVTLVIPSLGKKKTHIGFLILMCMALLGFWK